MKLYPHNPDYLISKEGQIWSTKSNRFLVPWLTAKGYRTVELYHPSKVITRTLHRLVLETFVGDRPLDMQCCHLDGNKENNNLRNLSWGSPVTNRKDSKRHCLEEGLKFCNSKLSPKEIKEIRNLSDLGIVQKKIAKQFNLNQSQVSRIVTGKRNSWVKG